MEIEVRQIMDAASWESFVKSQLYTLFVQSWQYGEFYSSLGESFRVFGVYKGKIIIAGSLVIGIHARRGSFLYMPYGPIIYDEATLEEKRFITSKLIERCVKEAKKDGYDFIRISPFWDDTNENRDLLLGLGFRKAPMHILAEHTWLLDLSQDESQLFSQMEKNHRNLVRRCQKEGVRVTINSEKSAISEFNRIHDSTALRHSFHRFSDNYIEKEFMAMSQEKQAFVIHGSLPDGTLDSSGIFIYYGTMGAYRHGASLNTDRHLPTSYLVQWAAITLAKKLGCQLYNFWGIAPYDAKEKHPFHGITHFKKGFGGFGKQLVSCHDLPLTWRYWINWLVESYRSIDRGFSNK